MVAQVCLIFTELILLKFVKSHHGSYFNKMNFAILSQQYLNIRVDITFFT